MPHVLTVNISPPDASTPNKFQADTVNMLLADAKSHSTVLEETKLGFLGDIAVQVCMCSRTLCVHQCCSRGMENYQIGTAIVCKQTAQSPSSGAPTQRKYK